MKNLTPHIMGVMDALEQQPARPDALRDQLRQATLDTCRQQHLPYTDTQVEQAVNDYLAESTAPVPAIRPSAPTSSRIPWKRPASETQRERKLKSRRAQFATWLSESPLSACAITGLGVGLTVTALLAPEIRGLAVVIGAFSGFGTFVSGDGLAKLWLAKHVEPLEERIPPDAILNAWATVPECRALVRQCLASPVPRLLQVDADHIQDLYDEHAARLAAQEEQVQHALRKKQLADMFQEPQD